MNPAIIASVLAAAKASPPTGAGGKKQAPKESWALPIYVSALIGCVILVFVLATLSKDKTPTPTIETEAKIVHIENRKADHHVDKSYDKVVLHFDANHYLWIKKGETNGPPLEIGKTYRFSHHQRGKHALSWKLVE